MENLRSGIMRNQEWDSTLAELNALDLAELVLGLLVLDAVDGEAALGIVDEAEVLAGLLDGDDVHESSGEGHVGADLAINLDETLHQDGAGLAVVERILEAIADEDDQGHALPELVRTGRRTGSIDSRQLVEEPVRGRAKALLVLLTVAEISVSRTHKSRYLRTAEGLAVQPSRNNGCTGFQARKLNSPSDDKRFSQEIGILTVRVPFWLILVDWIVDGNRERNVVKSRVQPSD